MKRAPHIALLAALLSATAISAVAQAPTAPAAGQPEMQSQGRQAGERGMDPARAQRMQERIARRMAGFKEKLAITPAQEGAWTTWTQAMKPPAHLQRLDRRELAQLSTPERLDRMRAHHATRMAEMDRRAEATKAFYAGLTAEQKKTFDEASLRMGKRGHGPRGHGGYGHHRG
jgi:periplasmic protein CpxP/Spy